MHVVSGLFQKGFRQNYWDLSSMTKRSARLTQSANRAFRPRAIREVGWYVSDGLIPLPVTLVTAQTATPDALLPAQIAAASVAVHL